MGDDKDAEDTSETELGEKSDKSEQVVSDSKKVSEKIS